MSLARNTFYNLLGTILPLGISIVTVPIYLEVVGLERYGVLSICWLLLGYFGLFDIGLGRAVTQQLAGATGDRAEERPAIFWSALWISVILSALAAILLVPASWAALLLIKFDDPVVANEVSTAVYWLALTVPVALITGILNGALQGRERFAELNGVDVLSNILSAGGPLVIALVFGPKLWILIAAALGFRVLTTLMLGYFCWRTIPLSRPMFIDRARVRPLLAYGGWITVSGAVGPLLHVGDRLAIGWFLGATQVSLYVVPFTLVQRLSVLPNALTRAMFPKFAYGSEDDSGDMQRAALLFLAGVMTPGILAIMLLHHPLLSLWLGETLADKTATVLLILLPGIWFNGMALIPLNYLQGAGRPKTVALIHAAELIPYGILLFGGLYFFGLAGAACAWTLRAAADSLLLFSRASKGLSAFVPVLSSVIMIFAGTALALAVEPDTTWHWAGLSLLVLVSTIDAYRMQPHVMRRGIAVGLNRIRLLRAS